MSSQRPKQPITGLLKERGYDLLMYNWIASIEKQQAISIRELQEEVLRALSSVGSGADTYKGYFKPIQTADNKIKIVDGMDIEATNCGQVSVNKLALAPVAVNELIITADAFIYLECVAVGDPMTSSTNTIVQYATEQAWETGKEKILISRVTFADSKITAFTREPVSSRVTIRGAC